MALTKTTAIDVIDAWQAVTAGTLVMGNAESISGSYATVLYIEVAYIEAAIPHAGAVVIIEVSYADDEWVRLREIGIPALTIFGTTLNDANANAGDTTITLTDATVGNIDTPGHKWFIKAVAFDGSEAVRTKSVAGSVVTLCQDLRQSFTDGIDVFDEVKEWEVAIPFAAAQVRVLLNNTDNDVDLGFTTRISKVTALV